MDDDGTANPEGGRAKVTCLERDFLAREDKVDGSKGVLGLIVPLEPEGRVTVLVSERQRTPLRGE